MCIGENIILSQAVVNQIGTQMLNCNSLCLKLFMIFVVFFTGYSN